MKSFFVSILLLQAGRMCALTWGKMCINIPGPQTHRVAFGFDSDGNAHVVHENVSPVSLCIKVPFKSKKTIKKRGIERDMQHENDSECVFAQ